MHTSRALVRSVARGATRAEFRAIQASCCLTRQTRSAPSRTVVSNSTPSQHSRHFSVLCQLRKQEDDRGTPAAQPEVPSPSGLPPSKSYSYEEIHDLTTNPEPSRILIDVREPSELLQTGRIPTAKSVPISSAPDAFFMSDEDFETKFGFPRPTEKDEVIFYCKAGVRSRQAALLAGQARPMFGGKVGNYNGSWLDWEKNGGKVEKEGEQGDESALSGVTNPQGVVPGAPRG